MKNRLIRKLVIGFIGLIFLPQVEASNVVLTESLTDKIKCQKVGRERVCSVETEGRYTMSAKISGDDFALAGIYMEQIDENTPMEVAIGDFVMSSTLSNADKYKLAPNKINGKWTEFANKCLNADCSKHKFVRHTSVKINGNLRGTKINIVGSSLSSESNEYGARGLADMCEEAGNGAIINVPATLTVDGIEIGTNIRGTCQVNVRSVTKNGETFQLQFIKINAKN